MSERFTIDGSAELEASLGQICETVRREVSAIVPQKKLAAIVLGGGYGRGEGGVLKTETGEAPYNDLEFYVFLNGNRLWHDHRFGKYLHSLAHRLSSEAGISVEFKIDCADRWRSGPVSMFSYDLVSGHRIVSGRDEVFFGCEHHREADAIPLAEASRLLFNRCAGLLLVREILSRNDAVGSATVPVALAGVPPANPTTISQIPNGAELDIERVFGGTPKTAVETTALPKVTESFRVSKAALAEEDADFAVRNAAKVQLALGDVVLTAFGKYHWSVLERERRLAEFLPTEVPGWLSQVRSQYGHGVAFKLRPRRAAKLEATFENEYLRLVDLAKEVWLWLESRRLNEKFLTASDYALGAMDKWPGTAAWRNFCLTVKTFGPKAAVASHSRRYPRARLFNALTLLLWNSDHVAQPPFLDRLQRELHTNAADWPGLVTVFKRVWPAYG